MTVKPEDVEQSLEAFNAKVGLNAHLGDHD
jgi:hypothetical protein